MLCRERLEKYLRENQVPFQVQHHARAFQAQKIAESEHIPGKVVAKTVIVFADGKMIALVLPATFRVDMEKTQAALDARELRLAREDEFARVFSGCEVGTEPPFGNLYGIPVCVEKHLSEQEIIFFPIGTATDTMSLKYADFERLVQPEVRAFAFSR